MLGWWIVIFAQTPDERAATTGSAEPMLASWETSLGGIQWIDRLVEAGKAEELSRGGYPNRYSAKACDILPLIADGPPPYDGPIVIGDDYVVPGGSSRDLILCHDKIATCPPERVLTIEAWDLS